MDTIGERIRASREKAGLTQKELSNLSGVSLPSIRAYEQGKRAPKSGTLWKISYALNVPVTSLETLDTVQDGILRDMLADSGIEPKLVRAEIDNLNAKGLIPNGTSFEEAVSLAANNLLGVGRNNKGAVKYAANAIASIYDDVRRRYYIADSGSTPKLQIKRAGAPEKYYPGMDPAVLEQIDKILHQAENELRKLEDNTN